MSAAELARRAVVERVVADAVAASRDATKTALLDAMEVGDRKAVTIAGGKAGAVTITAGRETWAVTDAAALLAWVKEYRPTEVETVEQVRGSYVSALLAAAKSAGVPVTTDGEVIPGIGVRVGDPFPSVRPTADAAALVRDAIASGELSLADVASVPALPPGDQS